MDALIYSHTRQYFAAVMRRVSDDRSPAAVVTNHRVGCSAQRVSFVACISAIPPELT
jgi:hypothetical protein